MRINTPNLAYALGYYDALFNNVVQDVQVDDKLMESYHRGYEDGHEDFIIYKKTGQLRERRRAYAYLYYETWDNEQQR